MTMKPTLLIASANAGKCREMAEEIGRAFPTLRLTTLAQFAALPLPAEGDDYRQNAAAKALAAARQSGLSALGDDSGLEVAGLEWGPGAQSARFAGPGAKDSSNIEKLLAALATVSAAQRQARFVCHVALATPQGEVFFGCGSVAGTIAAARRGENGFGYDPLFIPDGQPLTFAEMERQQKAALSHRTRALRELFRFFPQVFTG